jgi:outer membrane protein OmpA-like peptidoglycan-associated protein
MPTSSAAVRSLALAVFGLGVAPAYAQGPNVTNLGTRQEPAKPAVALPAPPAGPIESRLLAIPPLGDIAALPAPAPSAASLGATLPVITVTDRRKLKGRSPSAPGDTGSETSLVITITPAPFGSPAPPPAEEPGPPVQTMAALAAKLDPATPPPTKAPLVASIPFVGRSPDLTDTTRSALDGVGKNLADKRPRLVEVRAFATGDDIVSRQISLARALVVRAYLIDRGVKTRIDVGAFLGDDERVDILVPNT